MAAIWTKNGGREITVTRYTYGEVKKPRAPETGHIVLLSTDEQRVALPMDNGWPKAFQVGNESTPVRELG